MGLPDLTFARSEALWLLVLVPLVALLGWWIGVRGRRLSWLSLALRVACVTMIALALAQPLLASSASGQTTIFVVDRSMSVDEQDGEQINDWVTSALDSASGQDRVAIVVFGSSPNLASPISTVDQLAAGWTDANLVDSDYTDIESALALARALPVGGSRRIVLITDGSENLGSALNQISQAASDGTPIDVLPLDGVAGDDLRLAGASAPNAIWKGSQASVLVSVAAGGAGLGTVEIYVDGALKTTVDEQLVEGLNTFQFDVPDLNEGFHAIRVKISGNVPDRYLENDESTLSLVVRGAPRIMLVSSQGSGPSGLKTLIESNGGAVAQIAPSQISSRMEDLGTYDAFVLDDVSADDLTFDQMSGLQEAVQSHGKGMIVIGGYTSYGNGAYAGTVLEETLPVTVRATDGRTRPHVALLLIIDESGSMSYDPLGSTTKIEMAKEAARLALDALSNGDQIGILAFNDKQEWIVSMTTIDGQPTRDTIRAAIDTIQSSGGTEILPALQTGFQAIGQVEADARHIVLLSDGKSQSGTPESYDRLVDDAVGDRTTLSTIAIGDDADVDLLQRIADRGNGRYHFTETADDIPKLTVQETQSIISQSIITGSIQPIQNSPSPILDGLDPRELPQLTGYDLVKPKPAAQVVLAAGVREDPLLAKWQLGLGRVVAWTGDDGADFMQSWSEWPDLPHFWGNMINWVLPDPENRAVSVEVQRDGKDAVVNVNATGEGGDYVSLSGATASVLRPGESNPESYPLSQSGPGQYQFRIASPPPGAYSVDVSQSDVENGVHDLEGFEIPPSPELLPDPNAADLLSVAASRTGGRTLTLDDPSAVFSAESISSALPRSYRAIWALPLMLGLILFLFELANRYNMVNRMRGLRLARISS